MRIAFVGSADPFLSVYPPGGGIEHQIWGSSKELVKRGHEVHILERFRGRRRREVDGIILEGVPTFDLPEPFLSFLSMSWAAVPRLEEINPDVLYLAERFTAFFPSRLAIPKLFATHNCDALDGYQRYAIRSNPLNLGFFPLKRWMEHSVMSACNLVCPQTPSLEAYFQAKGFRRTRVIPNAVEEDQYEDGGDGGYILYSGQLRRFKQIDLVLKAFDELSSEFDGYRLLIAGTGPDIGRLQSLAARMRKRDRVEFLGWLSGEPYLQLLARCTFLVLSSLFETFPVVLLEAMACGKSVIAPRIMGPRDLVEDGRTGLLFDRGHWEGLLSCMTRLLSDSQERNRMGAQGRRAVHERYSFRVTAAPLEQAFEKMIAS